MNENLDTTARQIGNKLINLSNVLGAEMETWSDAPSRPNGLNTNECVGFISKEGAASGLSLVIDVQAPSGVSEATLRTWAIESISDNEGNERFNNIQLTFDLDYVTARELAQKGPVVTRDDISTILNEPSTQLASVIISNQSGIDPTTQQQVGERYEMGADDLSQTPDDAAKITSAMNAVFGHINDTATA